MSYYNYYTPYHVKFAHHVKLAQAIQHAVWLLKLAAGPPDDVRRLLKVLYKENPTIFSDPARRKNIDVILRGMSKPNLTPEKKDILYRYLNRQVSPEGPTRPLPFPKETPAPAELSGPSLWSRLGGMLPKSTWGRIGLGAGGVGALGAGGLGLSALLGGGGGGGGGIGAGLLGAVDPSMLASAGIGGGLGAGIGALTGSDRKSRIRNALVGLALGAGVGAGVDYLMG